jgi:phospholipase D1/2
MPSESEGETSPAIRKNVPLDVSDAASETSRENKSEQPHASHGHLSGGNSEPERSRKPARGSEPFEKWERDEMENILRELNGHLGMF